MTRQPAAPRHVVDTSADAEVVVRRLAGDGWVSRPGFTAPAVAGDCGTDRLVLVGPVRDAVTLHAAVLAAARGAGIVAVCEPGSAIGRALVDDLSRLGPVLLGPHTAPPGGPAELVPQQRALLERLAAGDTIAAAAAAEFLSLRTANRRIAEVRAAYGVRTTREAVLAYLRQRGRA